MAAALLPETAPRLLTPETLRTAAKQSQGIHLVPLSLRRAIKRYLRGNQPNAPLSLPPRPPPARRIACSSSPPR